MLKHPTAQILIGLVILSGFYWYETDRLAKLEAAKNFDRPAEDAPLTQFELDLEKGLASPEDRPTPPPTTYRDGSYTSNAMFLIPGLGRYTLQANITLLDREITAVSVDFLPNDDFEEAPIFKDQFRAQTLGEDIIEIEFEQIEDAKLTSNAFRNALRDVAEQSKQVLD